MNESLFAPGEKVLIACSGGKDSVYLVERLFRERDRLGVTLGVAHVDHGLRPESAQDAHFVRELAAQRGLPHFERRLELATQHAPQGIEALARRRRYEALEEIALAQGFAAIATAHHRDDQIETVLLRILQGAQPRHCLGMNSSRTIRRDSPLRLIRPLLGESRQSIEAWFAKERLAWREDASNQDPRFLRNRLRAQLAAMDETARERLEREILALRQRALSLTAVEQRLQQILLRSRLRRWETSLRVDLRGLPMLPSWFLRPLVEDLLRHLDGLCPEGTVEAICDLWRQGRSGAVTQDPGGVLVKRRKDSLEMTRVKASSSLPHGITP